MEAFLTLGKSVDGDLVSIQTQQSGRGELVCPFCATPLIAVKGALKQHHFRHDGETCRESLNLLPDIPGWDHFHLSIPQDLVSELERAWKNESRFYSGYQNIRLEKYGLISRNKFTCHDEFTDTARVIVGTLSLNKFSEWFRKVLKARIAEKRELVCRGIIHPAHLEIEAWRQEQILIATLYLFELTLPDATVFYKIGRTRRDVAIRLSEVVNDMEKAYQQPIQGRVIKSIREAGYVEHFTLWKHRNTKHEIGSHREYLTLASTVKRDLKNDLSRLESGKQPFDKDERFITSGRWRYEGKRLNAVRQGIALTIRNGGQFGRPEGTKKTGTMEWFETYSDVIRCLENGRSLSATASLTGKSISTVKRVKKALLKK